MFDEIYVFSNGRLVESGSFQDLLSARGQLANMWSNYQADGAESAPSSLTIVETLLERPLPAGS
jgi:hypothetical protein